MHFCFSRRRHLYTCLIKTNLGCDFWGFSVEGDKVQVHAVREGGHDEHRFDAVRRIKCNHGGHQDHGREALD